MTLILALFALLVLVWGWEEGGLGCALYGLITFILPWAILYSVVHLLLGLV